MVQRLGADVKSDEFEIYIKDAANALEWNMHPLSTVAFSYLPYKIKTGVAGPENEATGSEDTITGMGAIIADFSTLAFSPDSPSILVIKDLLNNTITEIPVVEYILKARPFEAANMTDKEYLDRQSNYRLLYLFE